jgi:hypothetical protein
MDYLKFSILAGWLGFHFDTQQHDFLATATRKLSGFGYSDRNISGHATDV